MMKLSVAKYIRYVKSIQIREAAQSYDFPPRVATNEKKIVNMNGTKSALFVNALCKPQRLSLPALSATDFVFIIISAGMLRRWKTSGLFTKHP